MKYLFQDSSGKGCAAKTGWVCSLGVMLYLAVTLPPEHLTEFLAAAAAFLGSIGAVYWGRNKTKEDSSNAG